MSERKSVTREDLAAAWWAVVDEAEEGPYSDATEGQRHNTVLWGDAIFDALPATPAASGHRPVWDNDVPTGWCECGHEVHDTPAASGTMSGGLDRAWLFSLLREPDYRIRSAIEARLAEDADKP